MLYVTILIKFRFHFSVESLHLHLANLIETSKHRIIKKVVGLWYVVLLDKWLEDSNDDKNDQDFYFEMLEKFTWKIWRLCFWVFSFDAADAILLVTLKFKEMS